MAPPLPPLPDVPPDQRASTEIEVRYEDIAQDGRLKLGILAHALGAACWKALIAHHPIAAGRDDGVVPILSRLVVEGGDDPVPIHRPLVADGRFQLAHTVGPDGEVSRLMLVMAAEIRGRRGRTHGPRVEGDGEPVRLGGVLAEHVFTRPFASAGERKVLRLAIEGVPPVPPTRMGWVPPQALLAAPPGAVPLDSAPRPDATPLSLGLMHTDSNMHVNSLVYPYAFEEAALRRLREHGERRPLLARAVELGYRKPGFAGEELTITLQAHRDDEGYVVCGSFFGPDDSPERPRCTVRMRLST